MKNIPEVAKEDRNFTFYVNNQPYIMLAAEVHNSACTSHEYMKHVWNKAKELNCNTILAPVYWEFIEPQENSFDYDIVDQLIIDARINSVKLVLLWFGSWKNGLSSYAPKWVKKDLLRFPRAEGEQGVRTRTLSMFNSEILSVETNAFSDFMKHLKEFDYGEQTVLAVQVENEVGVLGSARDFSVGATEEYRKNVPSELIEHMRTIGDIDCCGNVELTNSASNLSWEDVFQEDAEEAFMSWQYSSYINKMAKSGKDNYLLPMYTNAWLKANENEKPGSYPSGGPLPEMLDIWKCAAPNLDMLSPDIYSFDFEKVANLYRRTDNPLFIPETRRDKWSVANLYTAIGTFNTLCYAPFGLESIGEDKSFITQLIHTDSNDKNVSSNGIKEYLSQSYELFGNMMPIITKYYGTDEMIGFSQNSGCMRSQLEIGNYKVSIEYYHLVSDDNDFIPGAGVVLLKNEQELIFIGYGYRAYIETTDKNKQIDFLSLEKGAYDCNATWKTYMHLNGDEQRIQMEEKPTIVKALYYEF